MEHGLGVLREPQAVERHAEVVQRGVQLGRVGPEEEPRARDRGLEHGRASA
jgi:hypothetical protein